AASLFAQQGVAVESLRTRVTDLLARTAKSDAYPTIAPETVVAAKYLSGEQNKQLEITLRPTIFPVLPSHASQASEQATLDAKRAAQASSMGALAKAFSTVADDESLEGFEQGKTQVTFVSALPINDTETTRHVEALGVNLFGNQLVAVQVAGVLLL